MDVRVGIALDRLLRGRWAEDNFELLVRVSVNKNVIGFLLIGAALGIAIFYGWPKLQPYLAPPPPPPATAPDETPKF
jgi:hypothetical protein